MSAATLAVGSLLLGCAAVPPLPTGFDVRRAEVEPLGIEPDVQLAESGWTRRSAVTGGLAGAGIGFGAGGLACMGTGPLAPLCLGTVIPLTTVVGAAGGAAIGAWQRRTAPEVGDKQALLQREWAALADRVPLAATLKRRWPGPAGDADGSRALWRVAVGYATLGTVGGGADQPFSLEATARLAVWRVDDPRARVERTYVAQSPGRMTLAQWREDEALALRSTLAALADSVLEQISDDLKRSAR